MDSNEINMFAKLLKLHPFLGVYAADQLCNIKKDELGVLVCNTQPSYEPGEHWIGICLTKSKLIYFDSLNGDFHKSQYLQYFLKEMGKDFLRNDIQIQNYGSDKCGIHALVFCYVLSQQKNCAVYVRFLSSFSSHKLKLREELSLNYFLLTLEL